MSEMMISSGSVKTVINNKVIQDKEYALKHDGKNMNFGIKSSILKTFVKSNGVNFFSSDNNSLSQKEIGDLILNATVYVDCLMTEARYNDVKSKNQKVLYKKLN